MSEIPSSSPSLTDRRVRRTRAALRETFTRLLFSEGYASLSATRIAAAADVSRSTFYAHYDNLDALLEEGLGELFGAFARSCLKTEDAGELAAICAHFWDGRHLTRHIFTGRRGAMLARLLSEKFATALTAPRRDPRQTAVLGRYLAAATIGVLTEWLTGRLQGPAADIAQWLREASAGATAGRTPL
jgi:AcrR family transcriptional regulator